VNDTHSPLSDRSPIRSLALLAWRESRTARRRLLLYMSSISFGVGALVAIDSFSANVTRSVHEQSRALTGGDIAISARRPFPERTRALLDSLDSAGIDVERVTTLPSMAFIERTGATRLVQLRVATPGFPHFGAITTIPPNGWDAMRTAGAAVVDSSLLVSLGARLGDTLSLGTGRFVIAGTLDRVPGELGITAAIGPRVYIADSTLARTGLMVFGTRAEYEAVLRLPPGMSSQAFERRFSSRFTGDSTRVRTAGRNEERLARSIDQLTDFLALVALVALLLGGVGVASGVHAFVMGKIDTVAILRCLGATSAQVLIIYVSQAAAMGLVGATAGAAMGLMAQWALPRALADFLPLDVDLRAEPMAVGLGIAVGLWVALVFALRPLVALRLVSPLQALRRDTSGALRRAGRDSWSVIIALAIVVSVFALALARANTLERGLGYSGGIGGAIAVLAITAGLLAWGARRITRPGMPFSMRQGIAALHRPGNQTRPVVLALGFGVFLIGTLYQVQRNLLRGMDLRLDEARANLVFFDVGDAQRGTVDSIIRASRQEIVEATPIVRMRIDSINGTAVGGPTGRGGGGGRRSGWATRREYNSTYRTNITPAERLTAGEWFPAEPAPGQLPEISVETEVADELRIALGDTVTWNVQGVRVPTRVTSFREVTWATFQPNFFVVFQPAALRDAPRQHVFLVNARDASAVAHLQRDIVSRFPTISTVDLSLVQRTVGDVIGKVTMAIRFLAFLSVGLAIPVLFSAVSATRRQRIREGVLLKTLGATRRQIGGIMFAEYAVLGLLGSVAGLALSTAASWALAKWVFESDYSVPLAPMLAITAGIVTLAVSIGLLTSGEVFRRTPMEALRDV
jgi:putative ABC transport system permease protein